MKRTKYRLALFIATAALLRAECDCTHYPWKPESCYDTCSRKVLMGATRTQLKDAVGLSVSTVDDVIRGRSENFENLTAEERSEIRERLANLSEAAVQQLRSALQ